MKSTLYDNVTIKFHELDAMHQLALNVRAISTTIISDDEHRQRLLSWAQIVEDFVARVETS